MPTVTSVCMAALWRLDLFYKILLFITHHFRDYVLAPCVLVNNVSYLYLTNDCCMRPVSEPLSWICESPTYTPLNQIGKADKPYLHSSVAGRDYYQ